MHTLLVVATQSLPILTFSSTSIHPVKGADLEKFSGNCEDTDGFICAIKLAIAVQSASFPDEWTKMLYALSFIMRGTTEIWAYNQMQAIIDSTSSIPIFEVFIKQVKDVFGDPNHSRTACTKLHESMSTDEYTAQFEILAGRTNFNNAALEDAYS